MLGLQAIGHSSPGPAPGRGFGFAGPAEWRADFLALPGQEGHFVVDLLEWVEPKPVGRPYAEANHLGIYRMAFLVEDHRRREFGRREIIDANPDLRIAFPDERYYLGRATELVPNAQIIPVPDVETFLSAEAGELRTTRGDGSSSEELVVAFRRGMM